MKQIIQLIWMLVILFPLPGSAQKGFKKGHIVTANGNKLEGSIKPSFKTTGTLVFLSSNNKKETISPGALKSFSIEGINYLSYAYDFYEVISTGEKAILLKKATDNSGEVIYNGSAVVGFVTTTDGSRGDYYMLTDNGIKLDLITKKNFQHYFIKLLNSSDSLSAKIKDGRLGYAQIKTVVELYND